MTRRQALKSFTLITAAATMPGAMAQPATEPKNTQPLITTSRPGPFTFSGPYKLPPLPYAFDALEPHIDARTMEIHHDRHHKAYVDNLNKAVADYPDVRQEVRRGTGQGLERRAGENPHRRAQQRRRPLQPLALLADDEERRRRRAERRTGQGDRNQLRQYSAPSRKASARPAGPSFGSGWAWLVVAQRQAGHRTRRPIRTRPLSARQATPPRPRRLGARLLPEIPEQARRLHRRLVERRELGFRGRALREAESSIGHPACRKARCLRLGGIAP